jgi:class 3 adenylate cyclase
VGGGGTGGTLTVLFTDMEGSTELQSRLGDVEFDGVRQRLVRATEDAVDAHGGTVVKTLGDGTMATFAAASDALRAAVRVQQDVARLRPPVGLRVGISVGDVLIEDGDCHGTAVVEAARLCAAAASGTILCSDLVAALARGHPDLVTEPVGTLDLKGLPEPIAAREVTWIAAPVASVPFPAALAVERARPLVGRTAALEKAERTLLDGTAGRVACLVVGEPGIGKTRLVSEVAARAHERGQVVVVGGATEQLATRFGPWIDIVDRLVEHADAAVLDDPMHEVGPVLARAADSVMRRYPGLPPAEPADPVAEHRRFAEAVDSLLTHLSEDNPVVVVLEDLHWADESSLAVLTHLLRPGTRAGISVLGTYRDTDLDRRHPLSATLATLRRLPGVERIALEGLDADEQARLVSVVAGQEADPELVAALDAETEGNPFFLIEVLAHLAESGAYEQRGGRWVATRAISELGLPEGVREVVGRRLSQLSDDANTVLQLAAVAGMESDVDVLDAVTPDAVDAVAALEDASSSRLMRELADHPGRFVFSHALVRQTLLEELSLARRAREHWRLGSALAERRPNDLDGIAFHLTEGALFGDVNTAVDATVRAAEKAYERDNTEQALALFDRAMAVLDTVDDADPERRWAVHIGRGRAATARLGTPSVVRDCLAAVDLAERAGWTDRLGEAALIGSLFTDWALPHERLVPLLDQALATTTDPEARIKLLIAQSNLRFGTMELAAGRAFAEEAVETARDAAVWPWFLEAFWTYGQVTNGSLPLERDLEEYGEALAVTQRPDATSPVPSRTVDSYAEAWAMNLAMRRGDRDELERQVAAGNRALRGGDRFLLPYWAGGLALADGDLEASERICMRMDEQLPDYAIAQLVVGVNRCEARMEKGDVSVTAEWHALMGAFGPMAPVVDLAVCAFEHAAGAVAQPDKEVAQALALLDETGRTCATAWGLGVVAELAARWDRPDWAGAVEPALRALGGTYLLSWGGHRYLSRHRALAQVAGCLGDARRAVAEAEAAVDADVALRAAGLEARSRLWLAWALQRRNDPGDHERARDELEAALAISERLGFRLLAAECSRAAAGQNSR